MTVDLPTKFKRLRFPGRAGELQGRDDIPGLMDELGRNYEIYHEFLRKRLANVGYDPEPKDFDGNLEAYLTACADSMETLTAEVLARQSRRQSRGESSRDASGNEPALVDSRLRLISHATGKADATEPGMPPRRPVPCPFPIGQSTRPQTA